MVEEFELRGTGPGRCILGVLIRSPCGGYLRAVWFNQPFMQRQFSRGQKVMVSGKPRRNGLFWEMAHPSVTNLADEEEPEDWDIEHVRQKWEAPSGSALLVAHYSEVTFGNIVVKPLPQAIHY